ncbi:hypothetical protein AMTR_s00041p00103100 [Amborella trichopoda]|uniref:Uncharacterized protein n=1 Tax=Amborella trichopoda TaxID=13333 RepID=W1PYF3_AMBTC|nr:hypothetical protein AMTR_s00041p00103100 [Amborella trichopoda]
MLLRPEEKRSLAFETRDQRSARFSWNPEGVLPRNSTKDETDVQWGNGIAVKRYEKGIHKLLRVGGEVVQIESREERTFCVAVDVVPKYEVKVW